MPEQVFARDKDFQGIDDLITKRRQRNMTKGLDRA